MKGILVFGLMLGMVSFGYVGVATADTVTDTTNNIVYTATIGSDASDPAGTQDVTLVIDATGFNQGSGWLTSVAMQLGSGTITLESAPGGTSAWTVVQPGGLNGNGCDGDGAPFSCIENLTASTAVPASGTYTFVFDVTGLPSGITIGSDVKAEYNTSQDASGKNLGITSQGIDLTPGTTTPAPEPASLTLLGLGLLGAPFLRRRK